MAQAIKREADRARKPLTQARLKELLHYNPETGIFTWAVGRPGARRGDRSGSLTVRGRWRIKVDRREYFAHQLAFLYMKGFIPDQIDHRDTDQVNNRWVNLRVADHSQNGGNKHKQKMPWETASKLKGVMRAKGGKWCSRICVRGKRTFLGVFGTEQEAHAAYAAAAHEHFAEFARTE